MKIILSIFLYFLLMQASIHCVEAYKSGCEYFEECRLIIECGHYIETIKKLYLTDSIFHRKYLLGPVQRKTCGFKGKIPKICCPNEKQMTHMKNRSVPTNCGNFLWNKDLPPDGASTDLHEFPWLALLEYNNSRTIGCGGVLISERYVLTAAHCLQPPSQLSGVRLGEHDLRSGRDCTRDYCNDEALVVGIDLVIPHESYTHLRGQEDFRAGLHDIALIRLDRPVQFTDYVKPICLPGREPIKDGKYLAAGWGVVPHESNPRSSVKRMIRMTALDKKICNDRYMRTLTNDVVCASPKLSNAGCVGDSGGPLMAIDKQSRMTLVGIFTSVSGSCWANVPSIYTDVRQYNYWIAENMQ